MTEPAAKYEVTPRALPCPFCGSQNIAGIEWTVDDDQAKQFDADEFSTVWAFECSDCLGAAPMVSWNKRHPPEPKPGWHYPRDNADIENMPPPDTYVVGHYRREDGTESDPVILRFTGDVADIASTYRPITRWCAIPEE